jgi:hypothetical protein
MEGGAVGHNIERGPPKEIKITSKSFAEKFKLK